MTNKMKIYLVPYWMPFPSSEYGGLECIIAENDEQCIQMLANEIERTVSHD